jgi:hypothetical protein
LPNEALPKVGDSTRSITMRVIRASALGIQITTPRKRATTKFDFVVDITPPIFVERVKQGIAQ